MKTTTTLAILALTLCYFSTAYAQVTFEWATVGNPGNADDTHGDGYGRVEYNYRISKTGVTNAQYTEFLNAVDATAANSLDLFHTSMANNFGGIENTGTANGSRYVAQAGREQNPVTYVSWYDSLRFINWLDNGQPTDGTGTESGAYTLLGGTATPSNGLSVTRDAGATAWLPSEDEWYKAAYYDPSGVYFDYPNGSDTAPVSDQPGDDPSAANHFNDDLVANGFDDGYAVSGSPDFPSFTNPFTDVDAYTATVSPYGTLDQNGNVWEWNEALIIGSARGLLGGSWYNNDNFLGASIRGNADPTGENGYMSFRVASIPEQAGLAGDFDNDSDVDGADFLAWQRDPNIGSLSDWENTFGMTLPAALTITVPEPSTGIMLLGAMGTTGLLMRRRRLN